MTTEIAEKAAMENLPQLDLPETPVGQVISLPPPERSQLSARYYQQYSSTKSVTDLQASILLDECSFLEEIENTSTNGTGAGNTNALLHSIASKYSLLYENTRNTFHLVRALQALGRLVTIPLSSTLTSVTDSDDPPKANAKVQGIAAKPLSDTQLDAVNQTSSVLRKLWKATNDEKYLGEVIASAEYWLLLTSAESSDKSPVDNAASDGENKATEKAKTAPQRYALLREALGWVIELQKATVDDPVLTSSEANHIMALTASFTEKELKGKVFSEMAPKVLWEMGKLLSTRYAEYCNAPDAERCLTLGMGMFHYAVHLEKNKKEKDRYLVNWRILNTLRKRRFGIDDGDREAEEMQVSPGMLDVTISWNAHREAMAKFTDYRHFGMRMKEGEKVQLLEEAISLCHDALRIGRRVLLQPSPPKLADRPTIDDWMRNWGEMIYEKLQRCIVDSKDTECEEIKKLVEDELEENRTERIYNMNPQATILNLVVLARVLFMLYRQNPDTKGDFFETAMKHAKDALETVQNGLPGGQKGFVAERAARNALSIFYMAEHERTGKLDDLNKAISQMMKSLMSQKPHQNQGLKGKVVVRFKTIAGLFLYLEDLKTLASALMLRYRNTGDYRDLLTAITHQRTVIKFSKPDRFLRAGYQVRLSDYLNVQVDSGRVSSKDEKEKLLEEAIVQAEKAWKVLMTDGDAHMRAECLLSLTSALQCRYTLDTNKNAADHTAAVEKLNLLLSTEDGEKLTELDQARLMNKLCKVYETSEDLSERAMAAYSAFQAVELCPQDLGFLRAEFLYDKARLMQINDDVASPEEILEAFHECFNNTSALPATRLKAAVAACRLLRKLEQWKDLYGLASKAMALFASLPIRSLTPQDQQKTLKAFSGFGTMAAAAALEAGKSPAEALMILEQGRDIIARQKFDTRIDITDLREAHSELADEFERIRDRLDSPAVNTRSMNTGKLNDSIRDFGGRLERANEGLRRVVKKIHAIPGFSRFLEPPNEEELKSAAGDGSIVVINVAEWRCDAFIVRNSPGDEIESIPLPVLSQSQINQKLGLAQPTLAVQPEATEAGMNADFLQYLWDAVADPVLSKLGHTKDLPGPSERPLETYPRIWWCPTGNASRLPLHAASSKLRANKNCVMRRVVSSYTSSIKTLIFSRRQASLRQKMPLEKRGRTAVLCSVRKTYVQDPAQWDSLSILEAAPQEIGQVEDMLMTATQQPGASNTTSALTTVHVAEPKEETLLYYLCPPRSSPPQRYPALFHFAGHGYSNPIDPSKSCLFTTDSPLEVAELVALKLHEKAPLLAYLSACSTGVNLNGNDGVGALTDEGIHVMGAMQLVGFMSVIGALWKVEDSTSMRVAKMVYESWLGGSASGEAIWEKQGTLARCLHHAIMELRNTIPQYEGDPTLKDRQPLHWASFIHMGV